MRAISAQKCFELSDPFLKLTEMIIMSFAEPWTTLQQYTDDVLIIKAAALQGVWPCSVVHTPRCHLPKTIFV